VIGVAAALLLWFGTVSAITRAFGVMVSVMGVAFLVTAALVGPAPGEILRAALVPALPAGSGLLAIGLVGTTVVPYNLFLGSGLARGQDLGTMRFGLVVSVIFGGLISAGVLVVGTAVSGAFSYDGLAAVLRARLGVGADLMFAAGLFAAGFSSAVSAPLAAALTCRGLFGGADASPWGRTGARWRVVWGGVLAVGVGFGLAGVQPIPAIILAQAFNGVMLPAVAVVLLVAANDGRLVGADGLGGRLHLAAMALAVAITVVLGLVNLLRAAAAVSGLTAPDAGTVLAASLVLTVVLAFPVGRAVASGRRRQ
jgi:manganese transport protein